MTRAPAFIHVDLDNLWAIADCYGFDLDPVERNYLYEDALQRFRALFDKLGIRAGFFVVGRDLEWRENRDRIAALAAAGHEIGNHSFTHDLSLRIRTEAGIDTEVARTHDLIADTIGRPPAGFRAPGYAISSALLRVLARRGYAYDSSLMPSPYGAAFRFLDWHLRGRTPRGRTIRKTQFPAITDAIAPVAPYRVNPDAPRRRARPGILWELPVAATPYLRLPFQAGVCLSLLPDYFSIAYALHRAAPSTPLTFLLHLADLGDFERLDHPFFRASNFFSERIDRKLDRVTAYLKRIQSDYDITLASDWVTTREPT